jgi:DNA-binding transcriptional LysR family regulator
MVLPSRTPAGEGQLARVPWFKDRYATLIRADHPLAGRRIGWKRFAELEHVQVVTGVGGISEIDRAFRQHGLERRVSLRVGTFVLAVQALASGNRVATLPARVAPVSPLPLARLQTPLELLPFTLDLIFHPRMSQHPRHVFLRQALLSQ